MEKQVTPQQLRKRKALLVLPLLVIPFFTMAFWALGGGGNSSISSENQRNGLNLELPSAQLREDNDQNKLSFYEAAERDSAKWENLLKNDPFYKVSAISDTGLYPSSIKEPAFSIDPAPSKSTDSRDPNEEKVYRKLAELNQELNKAAAPSSNTKEHSSSITENRKENLPSGEVDRLETLMQNLKSTGDHDPELDQLNKMMEKILDIQHPERVQQRLKQKLPRRKDHYFDVHQPVTTASFSLLDTSLKPDQPINGRGFYSLDKEYAADRQNAVEAVIHQSQEIISGATVKLRLTSDLSAGGQLLPKGSFVYGVASLNNERLEIQIHSLRNNNSLFPVVLEVYDLDGLPGIYIPGAIARDVAKSSIDDGTQMLEVASLDPSLKDQAAGVGVKAAKSWLSKKARLVRIHLKAGYKVLLRDKIENSNSSLLNPKS